MCKLSEREGEGEGRGMEGEGKEREGEGRGMEGEGRGMEGDRGGGRRRGRERGERDQIKLMWCNEER